MKMKTKLIFLLVAAVFMLSGCGGGGEEEFSVDLAVTQTLAAIAQQAAEQPLPTVPVAATATPTADVAEADPAGEVVEPTATLEPTPTAEPLPETYPAQQACEEMALLAGENLDVQTTIHVRTFEDHPILSGDGCSMVAATDARISTFWGSRTAMLTGQITSLGWVSEDGYAAAGFGGLSVTYARDGFVCTYLEEITPASDELCAEDEPLWNCLGELAVDQIVYSVTVDCVED